MTIRETRAKLRSSTRSRRMGRFRLTDRIFRLDRRRVPSHLGTRSITHPLYAKGASADVRTELSFARNSSSFSRSTVKSSYATEFIPEKHIQTLLQL